jgi:uncharacterized membrane protein YfcA
MASLEQLAGVTVAAALGAAANSVAGGGTLLTFPALVGLGVPPVAANATSTVALWPGGVSSMLGYREALGGARHWVRALVLPAVAGGLTGGLLLINTPERRFAQLVPWLVLGATCLFVMQGWIARRLRPAGVDAVADAGLAASAASPGTRAQLLLFAVSVYGGYFGAGAGIIMLATFGFLGLRNVHQMNGLKNFAANCFNLVAATTFALSGVVQWPLAAAMAVGSTIGGHLTARVAQRLDPALVRGSVAVIGFASAGWLFVQAR